MLLSPNEYPTGKRQQRFGFAKDIVLQDERACFTMQNRRFYEAKQWFLLCIDNEMVTPCFPFGGFLAPLLAFLHIYAELRNGGKY
jgi:hypothetical protein